MDQTPSLYFSFSPYFAESMTPEDWQDFDAEFETMPESIKHVVLGGEAPVVISQIIDQYQFIPLQGTALALIIRGIAMGDLYIGNIINRIQTALMIDEATARDIATQI